MKTENFLDFLSKSVFVTSGNLKKGGSYNLRGKFDINKMGFWILEGSKTHVNNVSPKNSYWKHFKRRKTDIENLISLQKVKESDGLWVFQEDHFFENIYPTTVLDILTGGGKRSKMNWKVRNDNSNSLNSLKKRYFKLEFNKFDKKHLKMLKNYFSFNLNEKFISEIEKDISKIQDKQDKYSLIRRRIGQSRFRDELLRKYNCECPITGIKEKKLLFAGHIKPWAVCNNEEKLSTRNGLLLTSFFDCLVDKGLITFKSNGLIKYSKELSKLTIRKIKEQIKNTDYAKVVVDNIDKIYLKHHRKEVFIN